MGKRELVLIALFVLVGAVVYQVTAPPLAPGQEGFSLGGVFQHVRRTIQGRRARATVESTRTEPLTAEITEVRVNLRSADLTVIGEDRQDAAFALSTSSNGTDDDDAKRLAGQTTLRIERSGAGLVVTIDFPRDGVQQAKLGMRVPRRLALRVESKSGRLDVSEIAALTVKGNRGDSTITNIAGEVDIVQRGSALRVTRAGSLRLNAINADADVTGVAGVVSVDANGGQIQLAAIAGPLDFKSRNADLRLREAPELKAPLRVDMQGGELDIEGLRTEARIDGRNTEIRVLQDTAAPLTVYNTGDDVVVGLPPGGYTLDAIATDGGISSDDGSIKVTGDDREKRVAGPMRGGGPALTIRTTRGRIDLRKPAAAGK